MKAGRGDNHKGKSNVEIGSSNSELEINSDEEEQYYEFSSDDVEWMAESDDEHSVSTDNDNVELEDMVVPDSNDDLSNLTF
ncbi:hypothetical protein PTKIN_Ptkin19aG0031700 [Pterospermum kingtungense]